MNFDKFLEIIKRLKSEKGFKVYDTHVHPLDVMGILRNDEYKNQLNFSYGFKPSIVEKWDFNTTANLLLRVVNFLLPSLVRKEIRKIYTSVNQERLLNEMNNALVDVSVLIPIAPYVTTNQLFEKFSGPRFIHVGSLDIHNIEIQNIESEINFQIKNFYIKGIKLHPNLQGFLPQPSQNPEIIKLKLEKLYETAARHRLYLLFHGGYTNFFDNDNKREFNLPKRKSTNALLRNFINEDGSSEIFGRYDIPIIIAHLGHYATIRKDLSVLKQVLDCYSNVYFDTAGVSNDMIAWFLTNYGSKRLLFGSDTFYHSMPYSIAKFFSLTNEVRLNKFKNEDLANIVGRNYELLLAKLKTHYF